MNEALTLLLALLAGLLLGSIFFGGLWLTVQRGLSSQRLVLWFLGGLLLRMSIALGGFYFVADGQWERLLACLAGFLAARVAVTWLTRTSRTPESPSAPETVHAP
jgi:F1F0 ATPase subunit 2